MRVLYFFVQWLRAKPFAICLCAALSLTAPVSKAENLKEALTAAYLFNPTLKAARARLRSADNGVALAKAGYRPRIGVVATAGRADTRNRWQADPAIANDPLFSGTGPSTPRTLAIAFRQNVFDGFRTYNAVRGAEAIVEAGREDLRGAEQSVLLNAATAYAHVVRDQSIVYLRQAAIRGYERQLEAVRRRFQAGSISQSDVFQTQTALASAEADLSIAQGTLDSSRAQFAQYIGHRPGTLRKPAPAIRLIPASLSEASAAAGSENPGILAAIFRERAQEHQVKQVKGQLLPSLSLDATYGKTAQESNPYLKYGEDTRVLGVLSVPLYEGGSVSAQIRGAIETQSQLREQIDEARERARERVATAWGLYLAARGNIAAGRKAVRAARLALSSIREEYALGQKGTSDVIGAEQTCLNVQVALVSYHSDIVVATYSILEAMGRLDAYSISLEAELYDPARYYGQVEDAWYGWGASLESREDSRTAPVSSVAPQGGPVSQFLPFGAVPDFPRQHLQQDHGHNPSPGPSHQDATAPARPGRQPLPASNIGKVQPPRQPPVWTAQTVESLAAPEPEQQKPSRLAPRDGGHGSVPDIRNGWGRILVVDRNARARCAGTASTNRRGSKTPCPSARLSPGTVPAPSFLPAVRPEAFSRAATQAAYHHGGQTGRASTRGLTIISRTPIAAGQRFFTPVSADSWRVVSN
jgi:outer membrane protein